MSLDDFKQRLNKEKDAENRKKAISAVVFAAGFLIFIIIIVAALSSGSDSKPASKPKPPANTPQAVADKCLSSWDGNSDELENVVRKDLNDPSSMETIETRFKTSQLDDVNEDGIKELFISMEFTAANAFGGKTRQTATAYIDSQTCQPVEYYYL